MLGSHPKLIKSESLECRAQALVFCKSSPGDSLNVQSALRTTALVQISINPKPVARECSVWILSILFLFLPYNKPLCQQRLDTYHLPPNTLSRPEQNRHLWSLYAPSWSLQNHLKLKPHWHRDATKFYSLSR